MKLLICTQAVDTKDSDLGFFVRWIEEFAKHCEKVTVICLRNGTYTLPTNVRVLALKSDNKLGRALELITYAVTLRKEYTAVFVHMNPEYIVVAGMLWRLMNKKITLWYTHKSVNLKLRAAVLFAHVVFTASRASFRLDTKKVRVMGHGIDTDFFSPDASVPRGDWLLSAGRLNKSKRHDLAIRMAAQAGKELRVIGTGPEREHLEALTRELGVHASFLGGLSHLQVRDEFRRAGRFLHTSETGSLDKMILEAVACGCPVTTRDPALKYLEAEGPQYVRENHSLQRLAAAIVDTMQTI